MMQGKPLNRKNKRDQQKRKARRSLLLNQAPPQICGA